MLIKENDKWFNFANRLVKQGNSFCLRIPKNTCEAMNAKEGDWFSIKLQKANLELSQDKIDIYLDKALRVKELKNFSKEKLTVLITITLNEQFFMLNKCKGAENPTELDNMLKTQKIYREKIKKEFGEKVYKDYMFFVERLTKFIERERAKNKPQISSPRT
jgi:antitoxin component of MazEF toxin-antitoxin module